jgi:hypothetical protein
MNDRTCENVKFSIWNKIVQGTHLGSSPNDFAVMQQQILIFTHKSAQFLKLLCCDVVMPRLGITIHEKWQQQTMTVVNCRSSCC